MCLSSDSEYEHDPIPVVHGRSNGSTSLLNSRSRARRQDTLISLDFFFTRNKMARQPQQNRKLLAFLLTALNAVSVSRISAFQASSIVSYRREVAVEVPTFSASSASSTRRSPLSHHSRPLSLFCQNSLPEEEEEGKASFFRSKASAKSTICRCASRIQTKTRKWILSSSKAPAAATTTATKKGNRLASFLRDEQHSQQQTNSQLLSLSLASTKERRQLRSQRVSTRLAAASLVCLSTLLVRPMRVLAAMAGGMGGSKGPVVPMSQ